MRKLKILGLTVFAVFAITAVPSASAFAAYHIESESGGTITGSQQTTNVFTTEVGTVKCATATFEAPQAIETASTLTVHPAYAGCTLSGQKVTITTTGCNYELQEPSMGPPITATASLTCSGTNVVMIKDTAGLGCEIEVGSQGPLSKVAFTNHPVIGGVTESGKVLASAELGGIAYGWTAGCPNSGGKAGSATTGTYAGSVLFTGTSPIAVGPTSTFDGYLIDSASGGTITGSQQTTNAFTTEVGGIKCTTATFTGTQATETAATLTVHPEYTGCTLAGQKVTIATTGCNYEFQEPNMGPPITAMVSLTCSGSNAILVKDTAGLGCEVTVGSQGPLNKVGFTNESGGQVLASAEVGGIAYGWTAGCPNSGGKAGSAATGTYTGSVLLSGSSAIAVGSEIARSAYHIASPTGGTITGSQKTQNVFTTDVGPVSCSGASFSGSQATEAASTLTLHPTYTTCNFAGTKGVITTTNCNYVFQKPTTSPLSATVNVSCSSGTIVIKDAAGLGCEVKLGSQGPLSKVGFANESGKVLATAEVGGIAYSWTAGCPNAGGKAGSDTNGTYTGTVLITGSSAIEVT